MKTTLNQQFTGVFDKECVPFKTKMYKDTAHQQLVHRYKNIRSGKQVALREWI